MFHFGIAGGIGTALFTWCRFHTQGMPNPDVLFEDQEIPCTGERD